jgi:hypothetical protein
MSCHEPIDFEKLMAWWLGELAEGESARIDEHVLACAECARRAEWLAALSDGVRGAVRAGRVGTVVSKSFLAQMKAGGMRLREYRLEPGGSVNCTIHADDDALITRVRAPLAGVKRLDALQVMEVGGARELEMRLEDVPFDPAAGEVLFLPPTAWVKQTPAHTFRVRLVSVDDAGERSLGEYTFLHTPQA